MTYHSSEQKIAWIQALLGNCGPARAQLNQPAGGPEAPLARAFCGEATSAETYADNLAKSRPQDTLVNRLTIPELRAAIELGRDHPLEAIEALKSAEKYERAEPLAAYLRGFAYLRANKGLEASAQFQKVLDGGLFNSPSVPVYALSYLGIARAMRLTGNVAASEDAYEAFFGFWKNADADLPVLALAHKEYAALQ